ncbi:hypothetical protein DVH24_016158 [Malus domestica]|uniref:Uncharacterized protein n=1 Tax=Malus domestica TaxID=3750 RepID=A0A498JL91_MALDO|nr:hypothetical protein DVH24_016158 [Malus domestica]
MKHLRYLDLRHNLIKILPDWIVELSNLETLDLSGCENLVEMPRDIKKMINLRHLNLKDCREEFRVDWFTTSVYNRKLRHQKNVLSKSNGGALLKEKQHLRSLGLFWKHGEDVDAVDEKLEYISDSESSSSMSDEMMKMSLFSSLEELCVVNCPVLKGWWMANTQQCFFINGKFVIPVAFISLSF